MLMDALTMVIGACLLLLVPTFLAYAIVLIEWVGHYVETAPSRRTASLPPDERVGAVCGLVLIVILLWIGN